jgi:queuosine precursor transporter
MNIRPSAYKYLSYLQALFIGLLLIINLIGASKISQINLIIPFIQKPVSFVIGSGILFFPISYLIGDLLTEVYGYEASRKVIWTGFGILILGTLMVQLILIMPPVPSWPHQKAFEETLSISWRISFASLVAFAAGEFANSYVLAKMKLWTKGSKLWTRTIGSTICGEAFDTALFYPLAFLGNTDFPLLLLGKVMFANYIGKVFWEIIATPFTYIVVKWLKKAENEDYFDTNTDFNPFKFNKS